MSDGQGYDGYFQNNKFDGPGRLTFAQNDPKERKTYVGGFKGGQFHGYSTVTLNNGDSYKAKWSENQMEKHGIYQWANGDRARFTHDSQTEEFTFEDSRVIFAENDFKFEYRGELKDKHIMHGLGTLTLKCNMSYTGNWDNGESLTYRIELMGIEQGQMFKEEARQSKIKAESQSLKSASEVEGFNFKREN